jgi:hypothetical protein
MPVNGKHLLHYVPHGINSKTFQPLEKNDGVLKKLRKEYFGETQYEFVVGFNSRNSHRKHPSNLVLGFKTFCDHLPPEDAKKCVLLMHTDKSSQEGTDLIAVTEALCPQYKVIVDDSRKSPEEMCRLYNLFDMTANISSNEGFGLSIAESIMCGTPVIASVTGGLQDQLGFVDDNGNPPEFNLEFGTNVTGRYKKHGSWAKPLWTTTQTMQGSPPTPYIMDDFVDYKQIADGIMYWYLAGNEVREKFGLEGREWALNKGGINSENMCNEFIKAMDYTIDNFTPPKKFDMFVYSEDFNIRRLPQDKVGFDTHKINIEQLEQELELKQKST